MQISRTTDYAVRVVLCLAGRGGDEPVTAADIAREQGIPIDYVPKVLGALSRAGIVTSRPGRTSGARLLRSAEEISVLDIVEALGGPIALNGCLLRKGECSRDESCPVHDVWAKTQEALTRQLGKSTIAQLARRQRARGGGGGSRAIRKKKIKAT